MGWVGLERALLSLGTKRRGRRAGGVGRSVGACWAARFYIGWCADGVMKGRKERAQDGAAVGLLEEGIMVGYSVGRKEGLEVESTEGRMVDGLLDGLDEGIEDGAREGFSDGPIEGRHEGQEDGRRDGFLVGSIVGQ